MNDKADRNGDFWKYEVESTQRGGTTKKTLERRHGEVTAPRPEKNEQQDESEKRQGSDSFGIPVQFKD